MSQPCVVCGAPADRSHFCAPCLDALLASTEAERMVGFPGRPPYGPRHATAVADWVRRQWAERRESPRKQPPEDSQD